MTYDYIIVGGGIVGLATASALSRQFPDARIALIEKERCHSTHQSGRNSGVIHSGIYYKPGSYKARFARAGAASMVEFCREHGIRHEVCGKVIVATQGKGVAGIGEALPAGTSKWLAGQQTLRRRS